MSPLYSPMGEARHGRWTGVGTVYPEVSWHNGPPCVNTPPAVSHAGSCPAKRHGMLSASTHHLLIGLQFPGTSRLLLLPLTLPPVTSKGLVWSQAVLHLVLTLICLRQEVASPRAQWFPLCRWKADWPQTHKPPASSSSSWNYSYPLSCLALE